MSINNQFPQIQDFKKSHPRQDFKKVTKQLKKKKKLKKRPSQDGYMNSGGHSTKRS